MPAVDARDATLGRADGRIPDQGAVAEEPDLARSPGLHDAMQRRCQLGLRPAEHAGRILGQQGIDAARLDESTAQEKVVGHSLRIRWT